MLTLLLLAMAVAAGCTTTSEGTPTPATSIEGGTSGTGTKPSEEGEELPFAGAPKVDDPLDTTRFEEDPCQTLTGAQTKELDLPSTGSPVDRPLGNSCRWRDSATRADAEVHFSSEDPRGLSAMYDTKDEYAYFDELPPIEGYPAVATDVIDDRDIGRCIVVVGTSDEITFDASVQLSEADVSKKDPCEVAAQVAGMALETIKRGT